MNYFYVLMNTKSVNTFADKAAIMIILYYNHDESL